MTAEEFELAITLGLRLRCNHELLHEHRKLLSKHELDECQKEDIDTILRYFNFRLPNLFRRYYSCCVVKGGVMVWCRKCRKLKGGQIAVVVPHFALEVDP